MRQNVDGELCTFAYGEIVAGNVDPIEKKPFYHFLPGSYAYSIATAGCNFTCGFCQNWAISQRSEKNQKIPGRSFTPSGIVAEAIKSDCMSIAYTYTEPTIFFEYAYDIARIAKKKGLSNVFVTNGYMTEEATNMILPHLDASNVDLKFFSDKSYRSVCRGSLQPVLDHIRMLKEAGVWVEVTTLIVPGMNDSKAELKGIAGFLAGLDVNIPWHLSRFHPDHRITYIAPTPVETMLLGKEIGLEEGLRYVYLGNVQPSGDTVCPGCRTKVVRTPDFLETGRCLMCGSEIAGVWK